MEKPQLKIINFQRENYGYLVHSCSEIPFDGTFSNQTHLSRNIESQEITSTVPLRILLY